MVGDPHGVARATVRVPQRLGFDGARQLSAGTRAVKPLFRRWMSDSTAETGTDPAGFELAIGLLL